MAQKRQPEGSPVALLVTAERSRLRGTWVRVQGACGPQRPPDGGARDTGLGLLNHAVLWLLFQGPPGGNPVGLRILTLGVKYHQRVVKFFQRSLLLQRERLEAQGEAGEALVPSSGWRQGTPEGTLRGSMAVGPGFPTVLPHPCFTPTCSNTAQSPRHETWRRGRGGGVPGSTLRSLITKLEKQGCC